MADQSSSSQKMISSLSLAALGIVFGDLGTSPLYSMRESLATTFINITEILGVLSLIFWTLILVISIKYLLVVFRADNKGEGGVLALLALLKQSSGRLGKVLFIIGILGAGLMLGDGMITPAVSVLSAIEGLKVVTPTFASWIVPLACVILVGLFLVQSFGSAKIGVTFGPILLLWFLVIAILGIIAIVHNPIVLKAVNPYYAYHYLFHHGWSRFVLLGGIFLVVTGGEALYADLGHFGKTPIRFSWFAIVLPCLLLNYFGQGAHLLSHPEAIVNPFFTMSSRAFLIPLVILATVSTIIASQAVISATFSMTKQAILLGLYPRLPIRQTSASEHGQIYIPQINFILAVGTLLLVLTFQSSAALTHAYGIAVNSTMLLVTLMVGYAAYHLWRWNIWAVLALFSIFLFIDSAFLVANLEKLSTGGWVPILFAITCAFVMYTWSKGMAYLQKLNDRRGGDISQVLEQFPKETLNRIPNVTAVFITDIYDKSGISLFRFLKLNHILPENIIILSYKIEPIPYVSRSNRHRLSCLDPNTCQLTLYYGFMDFISIPRALRELEEKKWLSFDLNLNSIAYFLEVRNVMPSLKKRSGLFFIQKKIFSFLIRSYSANLNIEFYHLPYNRTVAIGTYQEI